MTTMKLSSMRLTSAQGFTNPRSSSGLAVDSVRELALHIGLHGLLTPLLVSPDGVVIGGQRRYRAIEMLLNYVGDGPDQNILGDATDDWPALEATAHRFAQDGIPVLLLDTGSLLADEGIALADNLMREDLSSYEIAARLAQLHAQGATGVELSRLIGKSKAYVSRKLGAFRGAGPELRLAWEREEMTEDAVQEMANMPLEQQKKLLAGGERPKRGPANRPGIDTVKDVLLELEVQAQPKGAQFAADAEARSAIYTAGVMDALRWVTGRQASREFAKLVEADRES